MSPDSQHLYEAEFLKNLFDEMQNSYERVSNLCSFGFNRRWRRQCVSLLPLFPDMTVCDMMTGTGESWMYILQRISSSGTLYSIDFSHVMVQNAARRKGRMPDFDIHLLEEDALASSLPDQSMDAVVSTYGVKTLAPQLRPALVSEIRRVLKPDGVFGLVEISLPPNPLLRWGYYSYLKYVVPLIGALFLGNHENYRTLSQYLIRFGNCRELKDVFESHGFDVQYVPLFGGCATVLIGKKRNPAVT